MEMNDKITESINDILNFKNKLHKEAENSEDVKSGECTAEEEKHEPDFLLYNAISESSIDILQQDIVKDLFAKICDKFGEDISKSLVELLAIAMTRSAYNAIVFYDGLLKEELSRQFDNYGEHLNATSSVVEAHNGVIEVLSKKISTIENELKIQQAKDEIN